MGTLEDRLMSRKKTNGASHVAAFSSDESGSAGIIFALAMVPLLLMVGAATDYTVFSNARSNLQRATDLAALSVAPQLTSQTTDGQAKNLMQRTLNGQYSALRGKITAASISTDRKTLCADSTMSVDTAFMKLAGMSTITANSTSCATIAGGVDPEMTYEVALVLDISKSMDSGAGGGRGGSSKIAALKIAAKDFVTETFKEIPSGKLQMSIAPFSAGVRAADPSADRLATWIDQAGGNSQHWIVFGGKTAANTAGFTNRFDIFTKLKAIDSDWDWGGCLEGPVYPHNVKDDAPVDAETKFAPFLAPDEPETGGYPNNYLDDDGVVSSRRGASTNTCNDEVASGAWNQLTHVCKYKVTKSSGFGSGPNSSCPSKSSQSVLKLTSTASTLTSKIDGLSTDGYTNLHEGLMWGWRTLSPNAPYANGRAYDAAKNKKIIVFMTDGYNNWSAKPGTVGGSAYQALGYYSYAGTKNVRFPDGVGLNGNGVDFQTLMSAASTAVPGGGGSSSDYLHHSRDALDELTLEACKNAKDKGIEIYTIGFSVSGDQIDQQGLDLLKACATNTDHYFAATDADQLSDAFASIGIGDGKLRLSK